MEKDGAHIIDIGGESTRPGAKEIAIEEELHRVVPVILSLRKVSNVPISIDTRHSHVAKAAIAAGADIVNDVSGGTFDEEMLSTVSKLSVPMILMHMRGTPETMQTMTSYSNVVNDVAHSLKKLSQRASDAGIPKWLQVLDVGIGFAKDYHGNLELLKYGPGRVREYMGDDTAMLLWGPSRKGFLGTITGEKVAEKRDYGTTAACCMAVATGPLGACNIIRVHNVKDVKQAIQVMDAIRGA
eukprot:CAMPEP_0171313744 /NCGR_PEP_ID=MMETSP0816-20121228/45152_1 /TAXON_ID=420281 /ORGANISM="Proboscia inermis, Strain CCAP1064/1" /LENGTH=240 /DNA_ID=CAMNT_0011801583 /DNA_START=277 /DNA_END=999 /DNA_ORIENTATION=+